jgi:hypothetical protein
MRCDALIIIISEQTGRISFADHGVLLPIDRDDFEVELGNRLNPEPENTIAEEHDEEDATSQQSKTKESTHEA